MPAAAPGRRPSRTDCRTPQPKANCSQRSNGERVMTGRGSEATGCPSILFMEKQIRTQMLTSYTVSIALVLVPMAIMITYMDIRYRRIPNKLVLITLIGGLAVNTVSRGSSGLLASLGGMGLAFGLMFFSHAFR